MVVAQKRKIVCRAEFKGVQAHTDVPHIGANAIEAAGKTITYLTEMGQQLWEEGPFDNNFEPPTYTTIQVCMVERGTAVNIVPTFIALISIFVTHRPRIYMRF